MILGPESEKIMMTGLHRVCDIHCKACMKLLGWTYVSQISINQSFRYLLTNRARNIKKENSLLRELMHSRSNILRKNPKLRQFGLLAVARLPVSHRLPSKSERPNIQRNRICKKKIYDGRRDLE